MGADPQEGDVEAVVRFGSFGKLRWTHASMSVVSPSLDSVRLILTEDRESLLESFITENLSSLSGYDLAAGEWHLPGYRVQAIHPDWTSLLLPTPTDGRVVDRLVQVVPLGATGDDPHAAMILVNNPEYGHGLSGTTPHHRCPDLSLAPSPSAHGHWWANWLDTRWPGRETEQGLVFTSDAIAHGAERVQYVEVDDEYSWWFCESEDMADSPAGRVHMYLLEDVALGSPDIADLIDLGPGARATWSSSGWIIDLGDD